MDEILDPNRKEFDSLEEVEEIDIGPQKINSEEDEATALFDQIIGALEDILVGVYHIDFFVLKKLFSNIS